MITAMTRVKRAPRIVVDWPGRRRHVFARHHASSSRYSRCRRLAAERIRPHHGRHDVAPAARKANGAMSGSWTRLRPSLAPDAPQDRMVATHAPMSRASLALRPLRSSPFNSCAIGRTAADCSMASPITASRSQSWGGIEIFQEQLPRRWLSFFRACRGLARRPGHPRRLRWSDPRELPPKGLRTRDIYTPDLHIDTTALKSRNFH